MVWKTKLLNYTMGSNKSKLNKIFLSASIPVKEKDPELFAITDFAAIRDAVKALAMVAIPNAELVWGGHPSITPLVRFVLKKMSQEFNGHVTLYQSDFYNEVFPEDNLFFERRIIIPASIDEESSLKIMRERMLNDNKFKAGIFIGGMKGVKTEYDLFIKRHHDAVVLPVASTGAAARIIYNDLLPKPDKRLTNDYAYINLFRDMLRGII